MTSYKEDILYHYGVPGMRWGVRRYQAKDGKLTEAGKKRRAKLKAKWDSYESQMKDLDEYALGKRKFTSNEKRGKELVNRLEKAQRKIQEAYASNPMMGKANATGRKANRKLNALGNKAYWRTPMGSAHQVLGYFGGIPGSLVASSIGSLRPVSASTRRDIYRQYGSEQLGRFGKFNKMTYKDKVNLVKEYEKIADNLERDTRRKKKG